MMPKPRRRVSFDVKGRLKLAPSQDDTTTTYRVTISDFSSRGAMVIVDLPCSIRLQLFEKINYCVLDFEDTQHISDPLLAKAVWLQPQTSAGDFMTFKIGLSFENLTVDMAGQLDIYASVLTSPSPSFWLQE